MHEFPLIMHEFPLTRNWRLLPLILRPWADGQ